MKQGDETGGLQAEIHKEISQGDETGGLQAGKFKRYLAKHVPLEMLL